MSHIYFQTSEFVQNRGKIDSKAKLHFLKIVSFSLLLETEIGGRIPIPLQGRNMDKKNLKVSKIAILEFDYVNSRGDNFP